MSGKKWVLLVAGSKDWDNYRHQANVCSAYQIIKKHGIPDEQIVVMMYDDIANNTKNPFPGDIVSVVDQSNVYKSVLKDYTGEDVNPNNFLAVLQGNDTTMRKIIRSGRNDNIFVYMSGLGNQDKFEFPDKSLRAADLMRAISNMSENHRFSRMVIFMASSFSGSMFTDLSEFDNVYAVSSCDESNKSRRSDYDKEREVYLSDQFSAAWLRFLSTAILDKTDFKKQFEYFKKKVETCPCEYGDVKQFSTVLMSEFLKKGSCSDCEKK